MTRLLDHIRAAVKSMGLNPAKYPSSATQLFIADAIWEEVDQANKYWKANDFPNIAPPYDDFFIEGKLKVKLPNAKHIDFYAGLWFTDETVQFKGKKTAVVGDQPGDTHWILQGRGFIGSTKGIGNHPGSILLHIDKEGHWLDSTESVSTYIRDEFANITNEEMARRGIMPTDVMLDCIPFCLMTLSLLHCRNVTVEEVREKRGERRRYTRETGLELSTHHILKIKPMQRQTEAAYRADPTEGLNRWHIVRGHFKTYEEPGLFGKFPGTYWWSDQARGNANRGKVTKSYEVEP